MSDEGLFLGRDVDTDAEVRLPADRLRTHGVVVGMTGSGKTGLCVVLLEELARAGVPVIAIDPKGDLGNLGLLFPELRSEDFAPWVEHGEDADAMATRWREGLAGWGIDGAQLARLRERLALTVLTPGSDAGVPVDVLGAFRRPADGTIGDDEARLALVTSAVSGLLSLAGHRGDPVRDPAHIVLSQILDDAWRAGEDPDLETLILRLVDPPFAKVGVFPVDRFFPADDRMELAMTLNGVAAAPSFQAWSRGVPLRIDELLRPPTSADGRTPVTVIALAHLPDAQRQFVLSLLLGRMQAWSRAQPGTSALRALLYFDEVAGYLPPHPHDPPTKQPLLTMMKQARAVGLGVVLATQNPVDVDYKALSNAGLWCIGRLQTRQDRDRLLKGLGRPDLDDRVEGLAKRSFLLHDARADEPRVMRSRWAMSYLRGPLTRVEIRRLYEVGAAVEPGGAGGTATVTDTDTDTDTDTGMDTGTGTANGLRSTDHGHGTRRTNHDLDHDHDHDNDLDSRSPSRSRSRQAPPPQSPPNLDDGLTSAPPPPPGDAWFLDPRVVFSARLAEHFEPHAEPSRADGAAVYRPALYADLELRFDEDRVGFVLDHHERRVWFPLGDRLVQGDARAVPLEDADLLAAPDPGARFAPLPDWLDEASELTATRKQLLDDVYRSETRGMFVHKGLKLYGKAGEPRESFEARCRQAVVERIHARVAKLKDRYETQADRIDAKIRAKENKLVELRGVVKARRMEEAVNIGETVLAMFSGRRRSLTSAMRKRRQSSTSRDRVDRTEDEIAALKEQANELHDALQDDVAGIQAEEQRRIDEIEEREVRLERNDIRLVSFGVLWIPVSRRV